MGGPAFRKARRRPWDEESCARKQHRAREGKPDAYKPPRTALLLEEQYSQDPGQGGARCHQGHYDGGGDGREGQEVTDCCHRGDRIGDDGEERWPTLQVGCCPMPW